MIYAKMPRWSSLPVAGSLLVLGLAACAPTQDEPADSELGSQPADAEQPTETARPATVPAGTNLTFRTDQTVSTDTHEQGDAFTATLQEDVTASDGSVAIPAGSESRWVVTRSETDAGDEDQALLAFRLESLRMNGQWVPLQSTVTEATVHSEAGDTGTETAAKVAVGTAAGAIIGQILGRDTESTLKGAGVGAAVGAVVALTTRGGKAELPEGSTIQVRLDEPVTAN